MTARVAVAGFAAADAAGGSYRSGGWSRPGRVTRFDAWRKPCGKSNVSTRPPTTTRAARPDRGDRVASVVEAGVEDLDAALLRHRRPAPRRRRHHPAPPHRRQGRGLALKLPGRAAGQCGTRCGRRCPTRRPKELTGPRAVPGARTELAPVVRLRTRRTVTAAPGPAGIPLAEVAWTPCGPSGPGRRRGRTRPRPAEARWTEIEVELAGRRRTPRCWTRSAGRWPRPVCAPPPRRRSWRGRWRRPRPAGGRPAGRARAG